MKYLVTGGAGFIGSNLVEELLIKGNSVRVIDNFSTGKRENIQKYERDIELIEGDIRNYEMIEKSVNGIEVILHQAALPSVPRSISDPITSNDVNINGTLNVLNAAKKNGVKRVVIASSSSVYGNTLELPKHEGMIPDPLSPYAVCKLTGEKYCKVFANIYGLETVALRYFNVFGPKQNPDSQYSAVIPKFIKAILRKEQPVIYGDGRQSRDFTYISNVVTANILASIKPNISGEVINIAYGESHSVNKLVNLINELTGQNITPVYENERAGDVKDSLADISKAEKLLGYKNLTNFYDGLKNTLLYYQS